MCRVMRSKDEVRIRRWIETEARLDVRDKFSMTALLYCAKFGLTNAISMLLQRQIPLHSRNRVGDNALRINLMANYII
jgi:ankyrin repeat protein